MGSIKITVEEIKNIVSKIYGLNVINVFQLNGYDDRNFHIIVNENFYNNDFIKNISPHGYVLKITGSINLEKKEFCKMQSDLYLHLAKRKIQCPKTVPTITQKELEIISLSGDDHIVHLLEYIEGIILNEIREESNSELFYDVGVFTAKIDNALQNFSHPILHNKIQWSLGSVPQILNYLYAIQDTSRQELVKKIVEEFSSKVLVVEDQLEKGVIHGDINEQNIIMQREPEKNHWKIQAIIDFGDCHYSCYIYELAIAVTYMIFMSNDKTIGRFVLNGYTSIRKVPSRELNLLKLCVLARFCQSLVLGAYGYLQDPGNKYLLTTATKCWPLLGELYKMSDEAVLNMWGLN